MVDFFYVRLRILSLGLVFVAVSCFVPAIARANQVDINRNGTLVGMVRTFVDELSSWVVKKGKTTRVPCPARLPQGETTGRRARLSRRGVRPAAELLDQYSALYINLATVNCREPFATLCSILGHPESANYAQGFLLIRRE